MNGRFILSAGMLAGTIIGAGVFALPYVVQEIGLTAGLFYLCGGALVYYIVHRMYAAVLMKAPPETQFFGLAKTFLSPRMAPFASYLIFAELVFVLVVYLALAPAFVALIIPLSREGSVMLFWFLGSLFVFARLAWKGIAELVGTLFIAGIVALVLAAGGDAPLSVPWSRSLDLSLLFLPLGPLLFSFSGRPALHALVEEWRRAKKEGNGFSAGRAIAWGTFIPAAVYAVFVVAVLRLTPSVTPEALNSLSGLSPWLLAALGCMGLATLWTSYFMIGANVKDILHFDLKFPPWLGATAVLALPLVLYFSAFHTFFDTLSFTGNIFLGFEGMLVTLLWWKAFPSHRFRAFGVPVALIFAAALVYEVLTQLGAL
jgi:tyrosine-specific transport protein